MIIESVLPFHGRGDSTCQYLWQLLELHSMNQRFPLVLETQWLSRQVLRRLATCAKRHNGLPGLTLSLWNLPTSHSKIPLINL
jgi:hypothetical protein